MNPQFQAQDLLQQQPQLQEIPANLIRVQQYQQQQQQQQPLYNSPLLQQRLLQRQIYNQQVLTGQNSQLPLQLQYQQLQQQYQQQQQQQQYQQQQQQYQQQQQLQRIQLIQKKQAQQGIIVGQDNAEQTAFSNQLLLQTQQNQLLQQQSQILQQSPQQLPQSLLLDSQQTSITSSQQLLQNNSLRPTAILNQSPTLNAKQTLLQQQLSLINQSPIQTPNNNLKTTTPQLQGKIKMPTSTTTSSIANTVPAPISQSQNILNSSIQTAQAQIAEIQSQLTKQSSLINKIPTSAINLETLNNANVLSIPTSVNALNMLATTTPLPPSTLSMSSATTPIDTKSLPLTSTAITTTTIPTITQAVTSKITDVSPLNKSQTSLGLQLSHAQLQSQLTKQLKSNQKSPPLSQQINSSAPVISSTAQIQNLNQIKKPVKQISPTSLPQPSPVNIPSNTITTSSGHIPSTVVPSSSSIAAVSLSKAVITPVTTTVASTTSAATAEKTKAKKVPSTSINSITIPTPPTQPLNSTNYQSLIQQQQKHNLTQLTNAPLQLTSKDLTLNNELEQLTTTNDFMLPELKDNNTLINKLSEGVPSSLNSESTKASKGKSSIDNKSPINKPEILTDTEKNKTSDIKTEPITHININYNDLANGDVNKILSANLTGTFNKPYSEGTAINPTYQNKSLINPIFRQQPSTQNEKIISKGSYLLKFNHFISVLTKETKYKDILFWKQFSNNYLSDKSKLVINLLQVKTIELKRSIISQFFDALAKSEINSINVSFGLADERYPGNGSCILESKNSIVIFNYNGFQINWYGFIKVLYDKDGKEELFEFNVKDIKKLYESNSFYLNNNSPVLDEYGMPSSIKRFVEIYEVVNKMDDLMNCSIAWNTGPKATLSKYASQYKQELKSVPLTLNQQLNNINKINKIEVNSPAISLSNSDSSTNAQNNNYNTLVDMMPPLQIPSSTNSSNLNSISEIISNNLNKKRLATTTLSPTTNTINTIDIHANSIPNVNSIAVGNNALNLNTTLNPTSLVNSVALNLPTSSSVLNNLAVSNAAVTALTNAGININTSSAAALTNAISAVATSMPGLVSPLHIDISNEPKAKKMKVNTSPRQRKKKVNIKTRNF